MKTIDHIPEGYGLYKIEASGLQYVVKLRSCFFCTHCGDVIWDYTNGPYLISCDKYYDIEKGLEGKCKHYRKALP